MLIKKEWKNLENFAAPAKGFCLPKPKKQSNEQWLYNQLRRKHRCRLFFIRRNDQKQQRTITERGSTTYMFIHDMWIFWREIYGQVNFDKQDIGWIHSCIKRL